MKAFGKPISLYFHPGTRAARVRWMLEELGVHYELKFVELSKNAHKTKEYMAIHPLGKVPALKIGEGVIFESMAICLYLAECYPNSHLSPDANAINRAEYYQWMAFSIGTLEPAIMEQRRRLKAQKLNIDPIDMGPALTHFKSASTYINNNLANKDFILGEEFSAADIMVGSLFISASDMKLLADFEWIESWLKRIKDRPAYQRASVK